MLDTNNNNTATKSSAQTTQHTEDSTNQSNSSSVTSISSSTFGNSTNKKVSITNTKGHFSILETIHKQEEKIEKQEELLAEISANTPFTREEFIGAWNKYIRTIADKKILCTILESCKPEIKNNFLLEQTVNNSFQEQEMQKAKVDILNFLRVELRNGSINLVVKLGEAVETIQTMTPSARLEKMIKEHPSIGILKEKFKLEL